MTATATHDTKRGEDARARLLSLSEVPDLWQEMVEIWHGEAGSLSNPDANDQYMLLQTIVGAWPLELLDHDDQDALQSFQDRLVTYIPKALREGKRKSKWIAPNESYENAAKELVLRLLRAGSPFMARIRPLVRDVARRGMVVSLARTVLKCTLRGVPDFYQGTAVWDFSLVDPDNRRPVDYSWRSGLVENEQPVEALLDAWHDGAIKQHITAKLLADRRARPQFYEKAGYDPVQASGDGAERVLCFTRKTPGETLFIAVPRLQGGTLSASGLPLGEQAWGNTVLEIPAGHWRDLIGGRHIEITGTVRVADLFETIPFCVLNRAE